MRFFFFAGKGGVGKSTMAAAAAWQLSKQHRVLIVSLDPAHNLGDIFGVNLKNRRKRFSAALFLEEVDLKRLAQEYLEKETNVLSGSYPYLSAINMESYFSILKYSPGIEEYALLTSIEKTIRKGADFDFIIFDTPPTGLTLRFLALPQVTIAWIERLTAIRRRILEKRHTIQKIQGDAGGSDRTGVVLSYREEDDEMFCRLTTLHDNYRRLTEALQGNNCGVILVFNPDFLSIRESERLLTGIKELRLPLRLMIQNKVSAENMETAARTANHLQAKVSPDVPLQRVGLLNIIAADKGNELFSLPEDLTKYLIHNAKDGHV